MIICICNQITKNHIQELIQEGHNTDEILSKLGLGSDCGTCLKYSIELMRQEFGSAPKILDAAKS